MNDKSLYKRKRLSVLEDVDRLNMLALRIASVLADLVTAVSVYEQGSQTMMNWIFSEYQKCPERQGLILNEKESTQLTYLVIAWFAKFGLSLYYNLFVMLFTVTREAGSHHRQLRIGHGIHGRWRRIRTVLAAFQLIIFIVFDIDYALRVVDTYLVYTKPTEEDDEIDRSLRNTRFWVISTGAYILNNGCTLAVHVIYILLTQQVINSPRVSIFYVAFILHLLLLILLVIDVIFAFRSGQVPSPGEVWNFFFATHHRSRAQTGITSVAARTQAEDENVEESLDDETKKRIKNTKQYFFKGDTVEVMKDNKSSRVDEYRYGKYILARYPGIGFASSELRLPDNQRTVLRKDPKRTGVVAKYADGVKKYLVQFDDGKTELRKRSEIVADPNHIIPV